MAGETPLSLNSLLWCSFDISSLAVKPVPYLPLCRRDERASATLPLRPPPSGGTLHLTSVPDPQRYRSCPQTRYTFDPLHFFFIRLKVAPENAG